MSKSRLERIFIRAQDSNGKWGNISLAEATDEQFQRWYGMYLMSRTGATREDAVKHLDHMGIPPVELKEGAFDGEEE